MSALALRALGLLAVVVALIAGGNLFVKHERGIGYQQRVAEEQVQRNQELEAARAETERLFRLRDQAMTKGIEREKTLRIQRDAALDAARGLRDDLAEYQRRLSAASVETARAYAGAGLRLLGECEGRYRAVAERAQGHYSDWKTLDEGWPQ